MGSASHYSVRPSYQLWSHQHNECRPRKRCWRCNCHVQLSMRYKQRHCACVTASPLAALACFCSLTCGLQTSSSVPAWTPCLWPCEGSPAVQHNHSTAQHSRYNCIIYNCGSLLACGCLSAFCSTWLATLRSNLLCRSLRPVEQMASQYWVQRTALYLVPPEARRLLPANCSSTSSLISKEQLKSNRQSDRWIGAGWAPKHPCNAACAHIHPCAADQLGSLFHTPARSRNRLAPQTLPRWGEMPCRPARYHTADQHHLHSTAAHDVPNSTAFVALFAADVTWSFDAAQSKLCIPAAVMPFNGITVNGIKSSARLRVRAAAAAQICSRRLRDSSLTCFLLWHHNQQRPLAPAFVGHGNHCSLKHLYSNPTERGDTWILTIV